jgi:hypothetical protein
MKMKTFTGEDIVIPAGQDGYEPELASVKCSCL